jgi:hypothetical protein
MTTYVWKINDIPFKQRMTIVPKKEKFWLFRKQAEPGGRNENHERMQGKPQFPFYNEIMKNPAGAARLCLRILQTLQIHTNRLHTLPLVRKIANHRDIPGCDDEVHVQADAPIAILQEKGKSGNKQGQYFWKTCA